MSQRETLDRLVASYPGGAHYAEAQFRRAEIFFSAQRYADAERAAPPPIELREIEAVDVLLHEERSRGCPLRSGDVTRPAFGGSASTTDRSHVACLGLAGGIGVRLASVLRELAGVERAHDARARDAGHEAGFLEDASGCPLRVALAECAAERLDDHGRCKHLVLREPDLAHAPFPEEADDVVAGMAEGSPDAHGVDDGPFDARRQLWPSPAPLIRSSAPDPPVEGRLRARDGGRPWRPPPTGPRRPRHRGRSPRR